MEKVAKAVRLVALMGYPFPADANVVELEAFNAKGSDEPHWCWVVNIVRVGVDTVGRNLL